MQRVGVLVWVAACSSSPSTSMDAKSVDGKPFDAMPDAFDACANAPYSGCVFGGLADQPFDGVTIWTATGTVQDTFATMAITETLYINRQGCSLAITNSGSSTGYVAEEAANLTVQDTRASYSEGGETPHPYAYWTAMCVDDASNAVHFTSHWQRTMPFLDRMIDVVLTH